MTRTTLALAACLLGLAAPRALAQSEEDLAGVVRSGVCPDDLTAYNPVEYAEHCAGMDESCALHDSGCFEDARRCWDDVNRMNKQIFSYNAFVRKCAARAETTSPPTKIPPAKKKN
jgi:hypothetical protein